MPEIHPNYIKAQRLMIFLLIASFIYFFLSDTYTNTSSQNKLIASLGTLLVGGLNIYLIGKGYWWVKYAMLVLFILSFAKPATWTYIAHMNAVSIISMVFRTGINLWILWLLFKVPNTIIPNKKGPDVPEPL